MPRLNTISRERKISLDKYFGEEAFVTVKYIPRDIWKHINRLVLKTADSLAYTKLSNSSEYREYEKKIEKEKDKIKKIELQKEFSGYIEKSMIEEYCKIPQKELTEMQSIENEKNKLLFEYGLDTEKHNFLDDNDKKVVMNYDTIKNIVSNHNIFDIIATEIMTLNKEFDLGEEISPKLKTR